MEDIRELIIDWEQESIRLLLKSKTELNRKKSIAYYAAHARLLMCINELKKLYKKTIIHN